MSRFAESGVPSSEGIDFTMLPELFLDTRDAKSEDVGAMAHIFIKSFKDDKTAQLLYPHDSIWPVIVEMLRTYLDDDYTRVLVAEDEYTDTVVGWMSVSLVTEDQDDYFKFCDSTVWAGRQLLRRQTQARGQTPLHSDEMKRAALITRLRNCNREGQSRHAAGQRLVINTIALHPDAFEDEIPEIAYKLIDHVRDIAKEGHLPLWAQVPQGSLGDVESLFEEIGCDQVGSFELNLNYYASEGQRRRGTFGPQKWTQWVLRTGNWERGRRYNVGSYMTI